MSAAEEFAEWMEYLAGRHHVIGVAAELAPLLAEEVCAAQPAGPAPGFPRACEVALLAASVDAPRLPPAASPAARRAAEEAHWMRLLETGWREAAVLARAADPPAWGRHVGRAAARSHHLAARLAAQRRGLGPDIAVRRRRVAEVSDTLFRQLWAERGAQLVAPRFRRNFCVRPGGAVPVLVQTLKTLLRDGGSHGRQENGRGGVEPTISGTRVRQATRLLRLSEQVVLAARIERLIGWAAEEAMGAAALLVAVRTDREAVPRLCAALTTPLAALRRDAGSAMPAAPPVGAEGALYALTSLAVTGAVDAREDRRAVPHFAAVLELCRADPDLPQTLRGVQDRLERYGGRVPATLSLHARLGDDEDGAEFGDLLAEEAPRLSADANAIGEVLHRIFDDPQVADALRRRIDEVFPDAPARLRGALLLGLPSLLPETTHGSTRLLAELPPQKATEWERLARILRSTVAGLKAEARELRRRLAAGWTDT